MRLLTGFPLSLALADKEPKRRHPSSKAGSGQAEKSTSHQQISLLIVSQTPGVGVAKCLSQNNFRSLLGARFGRFHKRLTAMKCRWSDRMNGHLPGR
jgi:hypothetical protein